MNDISDLVTQLKKRGAETVALQFPEGLKRQAAELSSRLRQAGFNVIISGDPCYGGCDLALECLTCADVLVHIGHAPVAEHEKVIFEPYPIAFDILVLDTAIPLLKEKKIGLVTTVQHVHQIPEMQNYLITKGFDVIITGGTSRTPYPGQVLGCSFAAAKNTRAGEILVVATGLFHATGVSLATGKRVIALDPLTGSAQVVNADPLLRRRFAVIQKAVTAERIGIIVSSKSGQNRMDLAEQLAALSPKTTIVLMREVKPDELLNLGFDAYVNTACPRLAYDDQRRFAVPVLSPQEFEILCGIRTWNQYVIDEIA